MCSRYSLTSPPEAVRAAFGYERGHEFPPRYNIAPTQPVAIVRVGADHKRELALVRWGLIPGWVKDPREFATIVNARAESALEKPSFKSAMRHRRCIIPADGFYEWTTETAPPASGARSTRAKTTIKVPHLIKPRASNAPMGFAGLWEHWLGADGSEMESMAILTVAANETVAAIHDRMPAILPPSAYDAWLDVRGVKDTEAAKLLAPAAPGLLDILTLSPAINDSRKEGADLVRPLTTPPPGPVQRTLL